MRHRRLTLVILTALSAAPLAAQGGSRAPLAAQGSSGAPGTAQASSGAPQSDQEVGSFLDLADLRSELKHRIPQLAFEVNSYGKLIERIPETAKRLADLMAHKAHLDQKKTLDPDDRKTQALVEKQIELLQEEQVREVQANDRLPAKQKELENLENQASKLQYRLSQMLSPEQQFKKIMSIAFAVLISLVIIGFFVLAGTDEKVRHTIFSGQAGIQFLTLFSLVIAIILFGITGILEGKELAALLGGLSGYILGRGTGKTAAIRSGPEST
jgi:hypothetical protein